MTPTTPPLLLSNPPQTQAAYLVWQSPKNHAQGTGRHYGIGMLRADPNSDNVVFNYLRESEDFHKATQNGFNGYTGIPLRRRDKNSSAFSLLQRRVPPQNRPDYKEYLARFGLHKEDSLTLLSVLACTGARQIGNPFSIAETFEGFDEPFQYIFDVSRRQHYIAQTPNVKTGDEVSFVAEPDNKYDPFAVCLKDANGQTLGYINRCQAKKVQSWVPNGITNARIHRVNGRRDYPRLFVMCDIDPQ
ncbi:MAG: hypothetical protein K8953_07275 [Proteobacteria bacterium]|nr:hypothetical protein [Pseudomonadota bacterium]